MKSETFPDHHRYGPEALQHKKGIPRPIFLILISLLSAGVALACAFAPLPLLCPAAVVAGLAFGAHWSLIPALASELFGLRYFASNYCLLQVPLLATYLSKFCYLSFLPFPHAVRCRCEAF